MLYFFLQPPRAGRPIKRVSRRASRTGRSTWHSQMTITRQPADLSARCAAESRRTLPSNFRAQNSGLLFGEYASPQSCLCQKQPCTKIAVLFDRKTISGRPGNSWACVRYRKPRFHSIRRTTISGPVSRPRMRPIRALRCSGVRVSIPIVALRSLSSGRDSLSSGNTRMLHRWPSHPGPNVQKNKQHHAVELEFSALRSPSVLAKSTETNRTRIDRNTMAYETRIKSAQSGAVERNGLTERISGLSRDRVVRRFFGGSSPILGFFATSIRVRENSE